MRSEKIKKPFGFNYAYWHGLIFTGIFVLYGLVKTVLSFMDRDYTLLTTYIALAVIGLILISFVIAFKDLKKWGWYGLIGINSLIVLDLIIDYKSIGDAFIIIGSAAAIYFLISPSTKKYLLQKN